MIMNTRMTGGFSIVPPMNHKDLLKLASQDQREFKDILKFDIVENIVETDEGTLSKRSCGWIEPSYPDSSWGVPGAMELLIKLFPKHEFRGSLDCVYEDIDIKDDCIDGVYRLIVRDGALTAIYPFVSWPDIKN